METLFDTFDFPRSSTDAIAPPVPDYSKTRPSNSTPFRSGGTHWRCAHCVESVLYSLANGHVEHVRMWTCCQCGFAENRVALWAACSMCDATSCIDNYACHYPSALEITTDGAMHDSVTYEGSEMARVKVTTMGDFLGLRAANDLVSTVQQNLSSFASLYDGCQELEVVEVFDSHNDMRMLMSIDDERLPGLGIDRADLAHGRHINLPAICGIDDPFTANSRNDAEIKTTSSCGASSSVTSALTKTSLTSSTLTTVTQQDLDSGYGSQSKTPSVDKASHKRANEADRQIPPKLDTITNDTNPPSRKKPRRRRCDTINPGLACPFYVRNPQRCENDSCVGPGFLGIHRLKRHLERAHLYYTCERCGAKFQGNATGKQDLAMHQRNVQPCQLEEKPSPEMSTLSHATLEVMRSKKGAAGKSEEERWREIYRLIFVDADEKELRRACEFYVSLLLYWPTNRDWMSARKAQYRDFQIAIISYRNAKSCTTPLDNCFACYPNDWTHPSRAACTMTG